MQYTFRLRFMEMLRLEREIEYTKPGGIAEFWAAILTGSGFSLILFLNYLAGAYDLSDPTNRMLLPAAVAFYTIRFGYITVRRLRLIRQKCGGLRSSLLFRIAFLPDRFEITCADHIAVFDWATVEMTETPRFLVFTLEKSWGCPLPKRVIPPDELPRLLALIAERIPPKPSTAAFSPLDPHVA